MSKHYFTRIMKIKIIAQRTFYTLIATSSITCTAKSLFMEHINHSLDDKINISEQPLQFKDAITVISGRGFVSSKAQNVTPPPASENPTLFWCRQSDLASKLKELATISKDSAIKELRSVVYAHYLDEKVPLIQFINDLKAEDLWLRNNQPLPETKQLLATWDTLVITVNNLLLW